MYSLGDGNVVTGVTVHDNGNKTIHAKNQSKQDRELILTKNGTYLDGLYKAIDENSGFVAQQLHQQCHSILEYFGCEKNINNDSYELGDGNVVTGVTVHANGNKTIHAKNQSQQDRELILTKNGTYLDGLYKAIDENSGFVAQHLHQQCHSILEYFGCENSPHIQKRKLLKKIVVPHNANPPAFNPELVLSNNDNQPSAPPKDNDNGLKTIQESFLKMLVALFKKTDNNAKEIKQNKSGIAGLKTTLKSYLKMFAALFKKTDNNAKEIEQNKSEIEALKQQITSLQKQNTSSSAKTANTEEIDMEIENNDDAHTIENGHTITQFTGALTNAFNQSHTNHINKTSEKANTLPQQSLCQ